MALHGLAVRLFFFVGCFMKKKVITKILAIVCAFFLILGRSFPSCAAGAGLMVGNGALPLDQLLSLILTVVSGSVIKSNDIFSSATGKNLLDLEGYQAYLDYLNDQKAGTGDLVDSYIQRASYLQPGNELIMSDSDFAELQDFARNHSFQFSGDMDFTYSDSVYDDLIKNIRAYAGFTASGENVLKSYLQNHSGEPIYITRFDDGTGRYWCALITGSPYVQVDNPFGYIRGVTSYCRCIRNLNGAELYGWGTIQDSYIPLTFAQTAPIDNLEGSIQTYQDSKIRTAIDLGYYNVLTRGRVMDQSGVITGDVAITIPWSSALKEQIRVEDLEKIYGLIHAVPIAGDATASLLYHPAISAIDYKVSESTISLSELNYLIEKEQNEYTFDLRDFFPFCIPFDIRDFLALFEATPEAPEITWKFPSYTGGQLSYIEEEMDLSDFDPAALILRKLELVAFIVGLAVNTRSHLIRG